MVFYRKYRPQEIEDLDSEEIREKLNSVLSGSNPPHAFLFTGPKGLGKTSTARIVAKSINCEKKSKSSIEPCNKCVQCVSITNGTNMDVLEIDGASNRGIDEIRDLREKIRLLPTSAPKKVYIIDEVHMLTTEAFNALLKTLEEPPAHALFVLCTTEPHKVPQTISSRCFQLSFKRATEKELVRSFSRIAKGEKLAIDKDALKFVAKLSDGSFRDGAKIMEEIALLSKGKNITQDFIEKKYQMSNLEFKVSEMISFLKEKKTKDSLILISDLISQGIDIKFFIEQLIQRLHGNLLLEAGVKTSDSKDSLGLAVGEIKDLVELLNKAHGELKYSFLPQLPFEIAVIEWGERKDEALRSPRQFEESSNASAPAVQHSPDLGVRSDINRSLEKSSSHVKAPRASSGNQNFWQELIEKAKPHNHSLAGVLRGCKLKDYDGKKLIIETGYKFHKEKLEEPKNLDFLEKICEEIDGKKVIVSVLLRKP